jgi:hypothetical protein
MGRTMSNWTPERLGQLHDLVEVGTSPKDAAATLGVSRDACISKAYQSGWRFRSSGYLRPACAASPLAPRRFSWEGGE